MLLSPLKRMLFILTLVFSALTSTTLAAETHSFLLCGNDKKARKLGKLVLTAKEQQRRYLVCDPLLSQLAQEKAEEMAQANLVSHTITVGANQRLHDAGFPLPRFYPLFNSNNVEAILGGMPDADETFQGFMNSLGHRTHLMGEHPFYRGQSHIGVGHVRSKHSAHLDYWVVYIAHHNDIQPKLTTRLIAKK